MSKISKQQLKLHEQAMSLVSLPRALKASEKEFVLKNFREECVLEINKWGCYVTSESVAWEFGIDVTECPEYPDQREKIVDLCAGIGTLSYHLAERFDHIDLVCVERNETLAMVGKKILPQATWIVGSVTDDDVISQLIDLKIQTAISNPPFGNIPMVKKMKDAEYQGAEAAYRVLEVAKRVARRATFILPHNLLPFRYSFCRQFEYVENQTFEKFSSCTEIKLKVGVLDLSLVDPKPFRNTTIPVDVVHVSWPNKPTKTQITQLDLFDAA
ncbi:methyltransferase [Photobacterium sp. GB-72]|uniref:methyltransferase n=1 Tax=Photobacterium sp. GB-72 TaxID=2022105 RepID=UPI000D15BB07|nr:methyltransferase [Photobacterium sp. GB-72]PSV28079.1 hypothetical protein C9J40_19560 [Photobacterium sp. GB-72]